MSLNEGEAPATPATPAAPDPTHTHSMHVMCKAGHTTVTWNPDDAASVRAARTEFNRLKRAGYGAFEMNPVLENGVIVEEKGQQLHEFKPEVGKVLMVPNMRGG